MISKDLELVGASSDERVPRDVLTGLAFDLLREGLYNFCAAGLLSKSSHFDTCFELEGDEI